MKENSKKSGRLPKADPTAFRCSVNFNASEEAKLLEMYEQSGISSLSIHQDAALRQDLKGPSY